MPHADDLIEIALENWRIYRVMGRALKAVPEFDRKKYENSMNYFIKRTTEILVKNDIRLVTIEGKTYSEGQPVTVLNPEEFDDRENWIVDQMVEPILLGVEGVIRPGVVRLRGGGD